MKAALFSLLILCALILGIRSTPAHAEAASTPACGTIGADTTWHAADSPIDVCTTGVNVASGTVLTIEPGVWVQFDNASGNILTVQGTVNAIGTPAQPITFTGVVASPGSWGGLSVSGSVAVPAKLTLDHTVLEYGGINGSYGAEIYADRAQISIAHSLISYGAGNGLYTTQNTRFDMHDTVLTANGLNAVLLNSPVTDMLLTGLSASGNGTDGVRLGGNVYMTGQRRWYDPGIPYIVDAPVSNQPGDALTLDPGSDLRFTGAGVLSIGGQLTAVGTPSQPITMTGTVKTPGSWRGLVVDGGTTQAVAQLDYVTVEYAGNDIHGADIEVSNGRLIAHHTIVRYSGKDGLRFDNNTGGSILQSQVYGNSLYGVINLQPARAVLASNTWWAAVRFVRLQLGPGR